MESLPAAPPSEELRWRIPTTGEPGLLRVGIAHVGLATLVAALIILVTTPAPWRAPALMGLVPLAVFVAYRKWLRYQRSLAGDDNLRIDAHGLYWLDAGGQEHGFTREQAASFRIERDPDTLRPVPALTLHLHGGFESQPIELHPPATAEAMRELLIQCWQIPELPTRAGERGPATAGGRGAGGPALDYDLALDVYSECHDDFQEWHFEGTRRSLEELFEAIAAAGRELAPPPAGAKPLARVLLCRRREPASLRIEHDRAARLEPDVIAAPGSLLEALAALGQQALDRVSAGERAPADGSEPQASAAKLDASFDLPLGPRNAWTFHLHIR